MIWILIAAQSWQWAVVARNILVTWNNRILLSLVSMRQYRYCKGIYSNLDYIHTHSLKNYWISNGEMWEFTIRTEPWVHAYTKREFTLIRRVNSRLFDTWIHAYSMREFTLIQCVNSRLYEAWINTCSKCEVVSEDSEDLAFLNHVISRDQNISCNHSPLPRPGCD